MTIDLKDAALAISRKGRSFDRGKILQKISDKLNSYNDTKNTPKLSLNILDHVLVSIPTNDPMYVFLWKYCKGIRRMHVALILWIFPKSTD